MAFAVMAVAFCSMSCSKPTTPASLAGDCVEYLKAGDFASFVETLDATEEQKAQFLQLFEEKGKKSFEKKGGIVGYEIVSEELSEDGQSATVVVAIEYGNGNKENSTLHFAKVDEVWKQVIKK